VLSGAPAGVVDWLAGVEGTELPVPKEFNICTQAIKHIHSGNRLLPQLNAHTKEPDLQPDYLEISREV
jgi:hypothetical protein